MITFIRKEVIFAEIIIISLLRYWPKTNSSKQIIFLLEFEDIIDSLELSHLVSLAPRIFNKV
jgi:serine/threonine-protein phosphatase 2A regulatory subunit B'